ncbi:tripartite motif-containing protein 45 isoform X2 [Orussus abietinus]|uniref:tripartite motif-containing protein 45 isoform X2 n=1 Tax=Orussus abietinus TaxID=222816 RepID=UPI000626B5B6|nr:tripartite motif-containing protein 45 isoform X2 [Orussus abietinus]
MRPEERRRSSVDLWGLLKSAAGIRSWTRWCVRGRNEETEDSVAKTSPKTGSKASGSATVRSFFGRRKCLNVVDCGNEGKETRSRSDPRPGRKCSMRRISSYSASLDPSYQDGQRVSSPDNVFDLDYDSYDDDEEFRCPRCGRRMQEPKLLPCLHPMCTRCVDEATSHGIDDRERRICRDPSFRQQEEGCPICEFPLANLCSVALPPHYPLQHRLVVNTVRRRMALAGRIVCCDVCSEEVEASVHCPVCLRNLCFTCGSEHERKRTLEDDIGHRVGPLREARGIRRTALCSMHPSHVLRFYCIACRQVTCRECTWRGEHRGHASEGVSGAGRRAAILLSRALQRAEAFLKTVDSFESFGSFESSPLMEPRSRFHDSEPGFQTEECSPVDRYSEGLSTMRGSNRCEIQSSESSHADEAQERIREFARTKRIRYILEAVSLGEELLADGSPVEILSLSAFIVERLQSLGVGSGSESFEGSPGGRSASMHRHTGVYHCCTFCSSGGRKEAACACNGTMPGGYKGCGHGHPGHPGVKHWSCCGSPHRYDKCPIRRKRSHRVIL